MPLPALKILAAAATLGKFGVAGLGDPGQWQLWLSLVSRRDAAGTALGCRSSGWCARMRATWSLRVQASGEYVQQHLKSTKTADIPLCCRQVQFLEPCALAGRSPAFIPGYSIIGKEDECSECTGLSTLLRLKQTFSFSVAVARL
eukprot:4941357-Amphidinium_carterae.1